MSKVALNMSMSLDGFIAGPKVSVELPMGEGGLRLHDWLFNTSASEVDAEVEREILATTGAVVLGKRTFDVGEGPWGDTPFPVPCFVLTHQAREKLVKKSGTFTFVTDGIESALQQAKAVAGEKNISLMGADVAQQFLRAGLLDEIQINLVPVLLGDGIRLFDQLDAEQIELERTRVIASP
ncbi:MAG: dihydrofolate reductase, partial [Chloroflexi bacterium]|nr:dihydrofolate reductase [Chloroflexota bacterium]